MEERQFHSCTRVIVNSPVSMLCASCALASAQKDMDLTPRWSNPRDVADEAGSFAGLPAAAGEDIARPDRLRWIHAEFNWRWACRMSLDMSCVAITSGPSHLRPRSAHENLSYPAGAAGGERPEVADGFVPTKRHVLQSINDLFNSYGIPCTVIESQIPRTETGHPGGHRNSC